MLNTPQPEMIPVIVGCTEIPEVKIEVEIPRIQIEIPKLNVGGGKAGIQINPPTPKSTPTDRPTIKPTSFGVDANNDIPSFVCVEPPIDEPPIIDDPLPDELPIQPPIADDGSGIWV